MLEAVAWDGRAVLEVAASFGVAWWTVQAVINTAAAAIANPDSRPVRHLGIDKHRYRRGRFFRDPTTAKWRRYEPGMTTMVDLDTGFVLGVVDGRGSAGVKAWLEAWSAVWRGRCAGRGDQPKCSVPRGHRRCHTPHSSIGLSLHADVPAMPMCWMSSHVKAVAEEISRRNSGRSWPRSHGPGSSSSSSRRPAQAHCQQSRLNAH